MHYNKWDIILVPFPFTDLSAYKRRPSLIISPEEYNQNDDLVIDFITSHITSEKRTGDYNILNWNESGLPKPGIIRMKFSTISKSIEIKKIGVLSEKDALEFNTMLTKFFS
ncbi:MAG: type II toxin-antitoxin system PemK/MazF family toxin [Ignavibacteria bacterium]|nr:type II toxin-antitoxin system PemK/MazF family toxin [Ignavibacteria bacterium]